MGRLVHIEYSRKNLSTYTPPVEAIINLDHMVNKLPSLPSYVIYDNRGYNPKLANDEFTVEQFLSPADAVLVAALQFITVTVEKYNLITYGTPVPTDIMVDDIVYIFPYGTGGTKSKIIYVDSTTTTQLRFIEIIVSETLADIIGQQEETEIPIPTPIVPCSILTANSNGVLAWLPVCDIVDFADLCEKLGCAVGYDYSYGYTNPYSAGTGSGVFGFGYCEEGEEVSGEFNVDEILDEGVYYVRGQITSTGYPTPTDFEATIAHYALDGNVSKFAILDGMINGVDIVQCGSLKIVTGTNVKLSKNANYQLVATSYAKV